MHLTYGGEVAVMQKIAIGTLEERLEATRARLLTAIVGLPDEALLQPNVVGEWSLAQYIVYLGAWEKAVAFGLREIQRRKKPTKLIQMIDHHDRFKADCGADRPIDDLEAIMIELEDARYQLDDRIKPFNHKDLNELKRHRWLGNKQLWPFIAKITYQNEEKYLPTIEAFAERWHDANS